MSKKNVKFVNSSYYFYKFIMKEDSIFFINLLLKRDNYNILIMTFIVE